MLKGVNKLFLVFDLTCMYLQYTSFILISFKIVILRQWKIMNKIVPHLYALTITYKTKLFKYYSSNCVEKNKIN